MPFVRPAMLGIVGTKKPGLPQQPGLLEADHQVWD
jgi:hypothetical protein